MPKATTGTKTHLLRCMQSLSAKCDAQQPSPSTTTGLDTRRFQTAENAASQSCRQSRQTRKKSGTSEQRVTTGQQRCRALRLPAFRPVGDDHSIAPSEPARKQIVANCEHQVFPPRTWAEPQPFDIESDNVTVYRATANNFQVDEKSNHRRSGRTDCYPPYRFTRDQTKGYDQFGYCRPEGPFVIHVEYLV